MQRASYIVLRRNFADLVRKFSKSAIIHTAVEDGNIAVHLSVAEDCNSICNTLTNEPSFCRICYDGPPAGTDGSDMVSPCGCSGSSAHIHVECLKKLYVSRRRTGRDGLHCPTCKQKYDVVTSQMLAATLEVYQERAESCAKMGKLMCDMGMYQTASTFYDLNLTIKQATYGTEHPAVALSLKDKGILLCHQQKYNESKKCLKQATEIFERVYAAPCHTDSLQLAHAWLAWLSKFEKEQQARKN
eukprot:4027856-Pyramimonas_sp.AAC.1